MRTRSKEAARRALPGPELPDEVWFVIAEMVGQKDWARASGTCKTFWKTQLRVITVQSNKHDELLWLSKR
ncbi:hypothetical protein COCOBI_04-7500 [Coccomyxa sp. Obi]|nr:hypothetical protein COCOBI_04-7500 [Coccomyxa sp. Obi]